MKRCPSPHCVGGEMLVTILTPLRLDEYAALQKAFPLREYTVPSHTQRVPCSTCMPDLHEMAMKAIRKHFNIPEPTI